jgi:hypothetical protein
VIPRRTVAAAALLCGALAPAAHASGTYAMDGKRTTHAHFSGTLMMPAVSARGDVKSVPGDCISTTRCDRTTLRLTLPKGSTLGRFEVVAHVERNLNLALGLYDAKGNPIDYADLTSDDAQPYDCCDTISPGYVVAVRAARLKAGTYTLIAYDRGGAGSFTADATYHARPPIRQTPKR